MKAHDTENSLLASQSHYEALLLQAITNNDSSFFSIGSRLC
jgi:hypothetical protein